MGLIARSTNRYDVYGLAPVCGGLKTWRSLRK